MKKITIYAFALTTISLTLNSCGMGKMISMKPQSPEVAQQRVQAGRDLAKSQVDYALNTFRNKVDFMNALSGYKIVGKRGDDIKSEVAKLGTNIADKVEPRLYEIVSNIDDTTLFQMQGGSGFGDYLKGSKYEMELRLLINQAISSKSVVLATNNSSNDFATNKILDALYYLMDHKK